MTASNTKLSLTVRGAIAEQNVCSNCCGVSIHGRPEVVIVVRNARLPGKKAVNGTLDRVAIVFQGLSVCKEV